jgi:phosphoribosyl 1,2-cyclic phosphate phosphodiesterase
MIKVRILGSGTSTGVPVIGCSCHVCVDCKPRNERSRSSIYIEFVEEKKGIVIDTSPDFRMQLLKMGSFLLDGVFYTHTHADHCHGFDDLRVLSFKDKRVFPTYLWKNHIPNFKKSFHYVFENTGYVGTVPQVEIVEIDEESFVVFGKPIEMGILPHGTMKTLAFKIGSFLYATDFKGMPKKYVEKWKGQIHTMVASGVRFKDHPTHNTIYETLELFEKLEVKRGIITHLAHDVDYYSKSHQEILPNHVEYAFDGLEFEV